MAQDVVVGTDEKTLRPRIGRPMSFGHLTPEEFDARCQGVLDALEAAGEPLTKEALLFDLGTIPDVWMDYRNGEGNYAIYSDAVKRAELRIARWWTNRLAGQNVVGAIYYTKSALGYRDSDPRQDVVILGGDAAGARNDFAQLLESSRPAKPPDADAPKH